jgi:hypothetical protein
MKKVSGPQVVKTTDASELPLPAEIQDALGELVGAKLVIATERHTILVANNNRDRQEIAQPVTV